MKISIVLAALTGQFETDLARADKATQKRMRAIKKEMQDTAKVVGAAFGAMVLATGALVRNAINNADAIGEMSERTGIAVETLSRLQVAAKLGAIDLDTLQKAVGRLAVRQQQYVEGQEKTVQLFDALGVSVVDASGKMRSADQVFADLADVFQKLPNGAQKTALAIDLFGRSGQQLIPFLNQGSAKMAEMNQIADDLGITLSRETAQAAGAFNDQVDLIILSVQGLATQIAANLLPDLVNLTTGLENANRESGALASTAENVANGIRGIALVASTTFNAIKTLTLGIVNLYTEMVVFLSKFQLIKTEAQKSFLTSVENVAAVTGAGATDAANSITGNGPAGVNRPGGAVEFIDPPKAAAKATDDASAALGRYYEQQKKSTAATREDTAAKKAQAEAEREAKRLAEERYEMMADLRKMAGEERAERAEIAKIEKERVEFAMQVAADIEEETRLMGLSNLEREKAIALRYANADAASAEGMAITDALEKLDESRRVAEGMDVLRTNTANLFEDLMNGTKSAKDAFMDFVNSVLAGIARIVAQRLTESLLGAMGGTGGGAAGGGWASLFAGLFGGARASGGDVAYGKAYLVGEQGPELFIPPSGGNIINASETKKRMGGSATVVNNFNMPGRYDLRTQAQIAATTGRNTQRALTRGTA